MLSGHEVPLDILEHFHDGKTLGKRIPKQDIFVFL